MSKRGRLVQVVSVLARKYQDELDELKVGEADLGRPDFLWHSFLVAMATMGNTRAYDGLIANQENYGLIGFDVLAELSEGERLERLDQTLRKAGVRMPGIKAGYLASNFKLVVDLGGPVAAKEMLLLTEGREGKIGFLELLAGIGPKYARNILMAVGHAEFRDAIAVDLRIKKVTSASGLSFSNYETHEQFYLDVAREVGLEGRELDRLLYDHTDEVVRELG